MTDTQNGLQAALFARLTADAPLTALIGASGVFDHRLTGRPMPYLVIAKSETSRIADDVEEHVLTLEAWSDADGRREVQSIADAVAVALDGAMLALADGRVARLVLRAVKIARQEKTRAFVAEMTLRVVVDVF